MTSQELVSTGVAGLSSSQRAALDRWLTDYTLKVIQLTQQTQGQSGVSGKTGNTSYSGSGRGHWIKSVSGNGAFITLEDGSLWEVESIDRIDTSLWLAITNITVLPASMPVGDYRYQLINTEDGEKALAKYLGRE